MIGLSIDGLDLAGLRQAVHAHLCRVGDFEPGAFQVTERMVMKAGNPCGIHFCLHGPRNVKLTAVVDFIRRQLFLYGTEGQRVEQMELSVVQ